MQYSTCTGVDGRGANYSSAGGRGRLIAVAGGVVAVCEYHSCFLSGITYFRLRYVSHTVFSLASIYKFSVSFM